MRCFLITLTILISIKVAYPQYESIYTPVQSTEQQRMMMQSLQETQRRHDQNLRRISEILNWIASIKGRNTDRILNSELDKYVQMINNLGKGPGGLAAETRRIAEIEFELNEVISSYNRRIESERESNVAYNSPDNTLKRGLEYLEAKNYSAAFAEFEKVIGLAPNDWNAYLYAGYVKYLLKQYEQAIGFLSKGLQIDQNSYFFSLRGWAHYYNENPMQAVQDFTREIQLSNNSAIAYYNRGSAKAKLNDYFGAIADYEKVIEIDPNFSMAYNNWGWLYFERSEFSKALNYLNKAIEIDPGNYVAYDSRAETHLLLENYSMAIVLNPEYANSYFVRGKAYLKTGQISKACQDFSNAGHYGIMDAYEFIGENCR